MVAVYYTLKITLQPRNSTVIVLMSQVQALISWSHETTLLALDTFIDVAGSCPLNWFDETARTLETKYPDFSGISSQALKSKIMSEMDVFNVIRMAHVVEYETDRALVQQDLDDLVRLYTKNTPASVCYTFLKINLSKFVHTSHPFYRQMASISKLLDDDLALEVREMGL